jgi:biopolymer transport protein ExbD
VPEAGAKPASSMGGGESVSHGPAAEGSSAEPNLTPLLDVVLQLLMFFMMCVNFVTEQVNEEIKLPKSESARLTDRRDTDLLFVNLKPFALADFKDRYSPEDLVGLQDKFKEGDLCVTVIGEKPKRLIDFRIYLKRQYEDAEKTAKDGKVNTAIVIRADQRTDYTQVYTVLHMCKVQGYSRMKLSALTKSGGNQ